MRVIFDKNFHISRPTPIRDFFASVRDGLESLWFWLPIVWQDRWWDYSFFVEIIEHKLRQMEKGFRGRPRFPNHLKKANDIDYCRILASRIRKGKYLIRHLRYHKEIWGESEWILEPLSDGSCEWKGFRVPGLTDEEHAREQEEWHRLAKEAERQEEQDYAELFRLLHKQIRYWWD